MKLTTSTLALLAAAAAIVTAAPVPATDAVGSPLAQGAGDMHIEGVGGFPREPRCYEWWCHDKGRRP